MTFRNELRGTKRKVSTPAISFNRLRLETELFMRLREELYFIPLKKGETIDEFLYDGRKFLALISRRGMRQHHLKY